MLKSSDFTLEEYQEYLLSFSQIQDEIENDTPFSETVLYLEPDEFQVLEPI